MLTYSAGEGGMAVKIIIFIGSLLLAVGGVAAQEPVDRLPLEKPIEQEPSPGPSPEIELPKKTIGEEWQKSSPTEIPPEEVSSSSSAETPAEEQQKLSPGGYFLGLTYSPLDLLIPSKWGAKVGGETPGELAWEVEYLRGAWETPFIIADLGQMTDERFSLIFRSYGQRKSFNFHFGVTYFAFKANLSPKFLDTVPAQVDTSYEVVRVESVGFNLGLGHRWHWGKHFHFGVDWLSWAQPVFITKNQSEIKDLTNDEDTKDTISDAVRIANYVPRLLSLKVFLNYSF